MWALATHGQSKGPAPLAKVGRIRGSNSVEKAKVERRVSEKEILSHDPSEGSTGKVDAAIEGHILCAVSGSMPRRARLRASSDSLSPYGVRKYVRTVRTGRRFPSSWGRRRIQRCQGPYGTGSSLDLLVMSELPSPRIGPGTGSETWPQHQAFPGYQVAPPLPRHRCAEDEIERQTTMRVS